MHVVPFKVAAVVSVASLQQYPGMTSLPLDHDVDWKSSTTDCLFTPQHSNYKNKPNYILVRVTVLYTILKSNPIAWH